MSAPETVKSAMQLHYIEACASLEDVTARRDRLWADGDLPNAMLANMAAHRYEGALRTMEQNYKTMGYGDVRNDTGVRRTVAKGLLPAHRAAEPTGGR